ncbi:MAG TPA: hypothetical protein PKC13_07205 [Blastocatellia bacterium]|nr:hypothetical protein [Blastocatellia bacterium]HMX25404.1 hypothetical protein [Blastocatellia bacterium]
MSKIKFIEGWGFDRATAISMKADSTMRKLQKRTRSFANYIVSRLFRLLRHFITVGYDGAPCGGETPDTAATVSTRIDRLPVEIKFQQERATALFGAASQTPTSCAEVL